MEFTYPGISAKSGGTARGNSREAKAEAIFDVALNQPAEGRVIMRSDAVAMESAVSLKIQEDDIGCIFDEMQHPIENRSNDRPWTA